MTKKTLSFIVITRLCSCGQYPGELVIYDFKEETLEVIEATKKRLAEWDHRYSVELLDAVIATSNITISYPDEVIAGWVQVAGSCYHQNGNFEIKVGMYWEDGHMPKSTLVHELLHMFMISVEDDYSHRGGWFVYPGNSDESTGHSLQALISYDLGYFDSYPAW